MHCPYCGSIIKVDETFCSVCGKALPNDINNRKLAKKSINKTWFIPLIVLLTFAMINGLFYLFLQHKTTKAKDTFERAEASLLDASYKDAKKDFVQAIKLKENFYQADVSIQFLNKVETIKGQLDQSEKELERENFQEALELLNKSDLLLKNYEGTAVTQMIDNIDLERNEIKLAQLKNALKGEPNIDQLKVLLWDATSINTEESESLAASIRNQIVDYTFSKASEQLNQKQFNVAESLVEDGLKYVPDSDKLQSIKTTIDKEKATFETDQQERIEQAMNIAAEEQDQNENHAIKLQQVDVKKDKQGRYIVTGEVSSVATVPVSSILIEYTLKNEVGKNITTNKVFAYPEKLYPEEKGKFEFTHYDLNKSHKNLQIEVEKITWYTN